MAQAKKSNQGITLIELLIAAAMMSITAMVAYPTYSAQRERVKISMIEADFGLIDMALERFKASNAGDLPPDLATVGLEKIDPWGNGYEYLNMALTKGNGKKRKDRSLVPLNTDYDLYSKGPDGRSVGPLTASHSRDDIIRANNGAFIGKASDY